MLPHPLKHPAFRYIVSGGTWDRSLRVWSVARGKEVASCIRHNDVITCLAIDKDGVHVVTGSKDTTAIVWNITGRKVLGRFVIWHIE